MCFAKPFFWSFCSLICKELAIIYSFLIGSNNSWSFVLCKKFDNPAHFNQRNQRNSRRGFLFTFSRHVLTKFFSQQIIFNLFRRFLAFFAHKSSFHDFCFVFGPFLRIPPTFSSILKVRTEGSFRLKLIVRFDNFVKYFIIFAFNSRVLTFGSKKVDCKLLFRSVCVMHEN